MYFSKQIHKLSYYYWFMNIIKFLIQADIFNKINVQYIFNDIFSCCNT